MDDIPSLQEQWERDWRGPSDALRAVQKYAHGTLASGSAARVNVLDAGVLDEQVETLLLEKLKKVLLPNVRNSAVLVSLNPELLAALRTLIWGVTVGRCGSSYGMDLQNVSLHRLTRSKTVRVLHYALSVLVPWAWTRFTRYMAQHGWWRAPGEEEESDDDDKNHQALKHKVWNIVQVMDKVYTVASVINFALFLWRGDYPTLVSRVVRVGTPTQCNPAMRRTILYGQMKRQLFWEGLTETTLLVMPLLLSPAVRRTVNTAFNNVKSALGLSTANSRSKKQVDQQLAPHGCALCGVDPARTAYISADDSPDSCLHEFCYLCAYRELAVSSKHGFQCPICHKRITGIKRVTA